MRPKRILIIQTAFHGDVILATPVLVRLHQAYPDAEIDFLVRKGCEELLQNDTRIHRVWVWDKKRRKNRNLIGLLLGIRRRKYALVVNIQRHGSTGLLSALSGADVICGFARNPFSFAFTRRVPFCIDKGIHETDRNLSLIAGLVESRNVRPELVLSKANEDAVAPFKKMPYLVLAPRSLWFSKTYPAANWITFLNGVKFHGNIYLIGGADDAAACEEICRQSRFPRIGNLAGTLTLLESAALIRDAQMVYVNDSAPLHLASAVNAPVTALFCSTVPAFGFGPLSDESYVMQTNTRLSCRPCGLSGKRTCPQGHFACADFALAYPPAASNRITDKP